MPKKKMNIMMTARDLSLVADIQEMSGETTFTGVMLTALRTYHWAARQVSVGHALGAMNGHGAFSELLIPVMRGGQSSGK